MTSIPTVHQFTAIYAENDAVGQHTIAIDSILREMGYRTVLFAEHSYHSSHIEVVNFHKHRKYPKPDMLLYQMSTGSPVADYLSTCHEPLTLNYHNITPGHIFSPWAPHIGYTLELARDQLTILAKQAYATVTDSYYNTKELYDLGATNITVSPVISEPTRRLLNTTPTNVKAPVLLFVGRLAPNKKVENLIAALAILQTKWKKVRLVVVGASVVPTYDEALRELVARLELDCSVDFTGPITSEVRDTLYSSSSVYVSASIHEGFCVPLIEAMRAGLPIVAHASTAVPETIGNAGLLVDSEEPLFLAKAVDMILSSNELKRRLVERGFQRALHFAPTKVRMDMCNVLKSLLESV